MSTTAKILEDKIELISWITQLKDNKVLDKLLFLMENYKPKEVVAHTQEILDNENKADEELPQRRFNTPQILDSDEEAFHEETKRRFPHLFKED